jgi:hypothetical protein
MPPARPRCGKFLINTPHKQGRAANTLPRWLIIVGIGVVSILGLYVYDRLLIRARRADPASVSAEG